MNDDLVIGLMNYAINLYNDFTTVERGSSMWVILMLWFLSIRTYLYAIYPGPTVQL
jgi:hypothetical protein